MKALQYRAIGAPPVLVDVETPTPGPGQVVLKMLAAGACHSDLALMNMPADRYPYGLPLTLGHEGVGTVHAVGEGVHDVALGAVMAILGRPGCGECRNCGLGLGNYCSRAVALGLDPPGLGAPGCMAEYVCLSSARFLVPFDGLDPVAHVAMTDAALTPYHAIKGSLDRLGPGSIAVVVGVGGLGHLALQVLRCVSDCTVVAVDVDESRLEHARQLGAHHTVLSNGDSAHALLSLTEGEGADVVFDFVGTQSTLELASAAVALAGEIVIVGVGGGSIPVRVGLPRYGVSVRSPLWGPRADLEEVFELARAGRLRVQVERFSLDEAVDVYERLRSGKVQGRAIITF